MLVACAAVFLKDCNSFGCPSDVIGFANHAQNLNASEASRNTKLFTHDVETARQKVFSVPLATSRPIAAIRTSVI
jgi:hypothetical protein